MAATALYANALSAAVRFGPCACASASWAASAASSCASRLSLSVGMSSTLRKRNSAAPAVEQALAASYHAAGPAVRAAAPRRTARRLQDDAAPGAAASAD